MTLIRILITPWSSKNSNNFFKIDGRIEQKLYWFTLMLSKFNNLLLIMDWLMVNNWFVTLLLNFHNLCFLRLSIYSEIMDWNNSPQICPESS